MRENADFDTLNAKQRRVAELLAAGKTRLEAAKQAGVGERTVYLWLKDEAFRAYLRAEESRLRGELTSVLRRGVLKAVTLLERAIDGEIVEPHRIHAARALLGAGGRFLALLEVAELHARIDALEERIGGGSTNGFPKATYH